METQFSEPIWRASSRRDALIAARRGNKNKIWGSRRFSGGSVRLRGSIERIIHRLRQRYGPVGFVFPNPQKEKGDCGGRGEQLGAAGKLRLTVPAERAGRQKNNRERPHRHPTQPRTH